MFYPLHLFPGLSDLDLKGIEYLTNIFDLLQMPQEIQNPLALRLLEGSYKEGDTVRVEVDKERNFVFK